MKLELKKFDVRNIKDDSVVLLIGKRNTGKSFLVRDIMYHHRNIPIGTVISPTEIANHFFEAFIPGMLVHEDYDPAILQRFVERQKKITDQMNLEIKKYGRSDLDPRAFMILDDCLYDKTWINDKNIRFLFMNGRHVKTFFLITMQHPLGVPPHLRGNVDYIFILRENQIRQKERIYEQYCGMFTNFEAFSQVLDQVTSNYECMVIDNKVQSNKLEDQVYWYKASDHSSFQMCSQELWDIQALEEEKKEMGYGTQEAEEPYNPDALKIKKNVPKISVYKGY